MSAFFFLPQRKTYYHRSIIPRRLRPFFKGRQQYCSSGCGKEGRWTRYWHANREKINRRRRKG